MSHCPQCDTQVHRATNPKELAELVEEVRVHMLEAEKTSYWRQYEQGMLGRQAVLILINIANVVLDTRDTYVITQ